MPPFDAFVINLDGSDDRLSEIAQNLAACGIGFTRVAAVDGRLRPPEADPDYDARAARAEMGRVLMGGEIGCFKSHRRALEAFLASGAAYGLVLEDDAELLPDTAEVLGAALDWLAAHPGWRLINIGHPELRFATPLARFGAHQLVAAHYAPMGAFAILWSRAAAEEFLALSARIGAPVDNALQNWLCRAGGGLAFAPPLARVTDAASVIDDTPRDAKPARGNYRRGWNYGLAKQRRLWRNKLWAWAHKTGLVR